jgi:hypothetical protein
MTENPSSQLCLNAAKLTTTCHGNIFEISATYIWTAYCVFVINARRLTHFPLYQTVPSERERRQARALV